ncbi:TrkH family potassium uptake protein [Beduinella massiliensis]|uniref:TrkH family potassium uptake protein n=1 Tax=Beduinella massiliensis TaxID=1852363 RepID=UPI000C86129A
MFRFKRLQLSYQQMIALGFLGLILLGAVLLMLPFSSRSFSWTDPLSALFTATSAVCVTGLVVLDTATHWSVFGQLVLLVLIQIGGLGLMTVATLFSFALRRKIGLAERSLLQESVASLSIGGVVRLTRRILLGTLIFEGAGALLLSLRFVPRYGLLSGVYMSIFHAISAFCNAGFDLLGRPDALYISLTEYVSDPLVTLTISALILIGGLGFIVWDDLAKHRLHWRRYFLHTKIVLISTAALVLLPTVLFLIMERTDTMQGMGVGESLLASLFSAITPRTAGFNTVDTALLGDGSKLLTMVLMFIGGSPGSTAGGIKTTTMAVLLLSAAATLRHTHDTSVLGRRLDQDVVHRASSVATVYLGMVVAATLLICMLQPELLLPDVLFEVFSAVDTVGMSTGITRALSPVSRLVVMVLMYCGRVGSLTFALIFTERRRPPAVQQPVEKILVG